MARIRLSLCFLLLAGSTAHACSVPVFRYALEQWPPSSYQLIVFHRGPLSAADQESIRSIRAAGRSANIRISEADVAGDLAPDTRAIWDAEGPATALPRVVIRYPDTDAKVPSLWSGPLAATVTKDWIDSPARRLLFERLTSGYAGVVLLLLSGDPTADEAARGQLRRELPRIAARIELPPRTKDGPQVRSDIPVRVEFPVIEVSRQPAEAPLVQMLLGSEDGLDRVRGPIAFPVFGRGRALCSLHGNQLAKSGELQQALELLCRACSCQVKELNPGVDLLVSGNWEVIFEAEPGPMPREATGILPAERRPAGDRGPGQTELRAAPPAGYDAIEVIGQRTADNPRSHWRRIATVMAVILVVLTGVWALRARRPPLDRS